MKNLNLSENNKNIKKTKKIISSKIQNEENKYNKFNLVVSRGQTLSSILKKLNFSEAKRFQIINEIEKYFNLRQLKENQKIVYYKDKNKEIKLLEIYKSIDSILSVKIEDKVIAEEKIKKNLLSRV